MVFRIDGVEVYAEPALVGKLRAYLRLRGDDERSLLLGASGVLSLRSPDSQFVELGELRMSSPDDAVELGRNRDAGCMVELFVTQEMLRAIEEMRRGSRLDLQFRIAFWGMRLDAGQDAPGFRLTLTHYAKIERSQWIEDFLPVFGGDQIELWEVRTSPSPRVDQLEHERGLLHQALQDFNAGNYEDAFRDCRAAIESLRTRQEELRIEELMGKEEWKRANGYLSIALHAENVIFARINRADAEFALTLTHAIYRRVAQAAAEPKSDLTNGKTSTLEPAVQ